MLLLLFNRFIAMHQFKSSTNAPSTNKPPLKFSKTKSPFTQKIPSALLLKNVLTSSVEKGFQPMKSPTNYFKKGPISTFPHRPETTYPKINQGGRSFNLTDSTPLTQTACFGKCPSSVETSRETDKSNPNSTSIESGEKVNVKEPNPEVDNPLILSVGDPSGRIEQMQLDINNLKHKLSDAVRKRDQFQKKLEEANQQLNTVKETNRDQSKKIIELTNLNNQLQADLLVSSSKLKQKQRSQLSVEKENELKLLVVALSRQKHDLTNKVSELLQQKAQKDNEETFNKIEKAKTENELENTRIDQLQEIQSLKSRINELELQQNQNEREYYEERIRLLEGEVKQLLSKCMEGSGKQ